MANEYASNLSGIADIINSLAQLAEPSSAETQQRELAFRREMQEAGAATAAEAAKQLAITQAAAAKQIADARVDAAKLLATATAAEQTADRTFRQKIHDAERDAEKDRFQKEMSLSLGMKKFELATAAENDLREYFVTTFGGLHELDSTPGGQAVVQQQLANAAQNTQTKLTAMEQLNADLQATNKRVNELREAKSFYTWSENIEETLLQAHPEIAMSTGKDYNFHGEKELSDLKKVLIANSTYEENGVKVLSPELKKWFKGQENPEGKMQEFVAMMPFSRITQMQEDEARNQQLRTGKLEEYIKETEIALTSTEASLQEYYKQATDNLILQLSPDVKGGKKRELSLNELIRVKKLATSVVGDDQENLQDVVEEMQELWAGYENKIYQWATENRINPELVQKMMMGIQSAAQGDTIGDRAQLTNFMSMIYSDNHGFLRQHFIHGKMTDGTKNAMNLYFGSARRRMMILQGQQKYNETGIIPEPGSINDIDDPIRDTAVDERNRVYMDKYYKNSIVINVAGRTQLVDPDKGGIVLLGKETGETEEIDDPNNPGQLVTNYLRTDDEIQTLGPTEMKNIITQKLLSEKDPDRIIYYKKKIEELGGLIGTPLTLQSLGGQTQIDYTNLSDKELEELVSNLTSGGGAVKERTINAWAVEPSAFYRQDKNTLMEIKAAEKAGVQSSNIFDTEDGQSLGLEAYITWAEGEMEAEGIYSNIIGGLASTESIEGILRTKISNKMYEHLYGTAPHVLDPKPTDFNRATGEPGIWVQTGTGLRGESIREFVASKRVPVYDYLNDEEKKLVDQNVEKLKKLHDIKLKKFFKNLQTIPQKNRLLELSNEIKKGTFIKDPQRGDLRSAIPRDERLDLAQEIIQGDFAVATPSRRSPRSLARIEEPGSFNQIVGGVDMSIFS